jgi:hypothetical protein
MKLSKPEEMDGFEETSPDQPENNPASNSRGSGNNQNVDTVAGKMDVGAAVELHDDMLSNPNQFGISSMENVRELRDVIEEQRQAIVELVDTVELLAKRQGTDVLGGDAPSVRFDYENLSGIQDPVKEFEG